MRCHVRREASHHRLDFQPPDRWFFAMDLYWWDYPDPFVWWHVGKIECKTSSAFFIGLCAHRSVVLPRRGLGSGCYWCVRNRWWCYLCAGHADATRNEGRGRGRYGLLRLSRHVRAYTRPSYCSSRNHITLAYCSSSSSGLLLDSCK